MYSANLTSCQLDYLNKPLHDYAYDCFRNIWPNSRIGLCWKWHNSTLPCAAGATNTLQLIMSSTGSDCNCFAKYNQHTNRPLTVMHVGQNTSRLSFC
jgi:hypothetical protein